MTFRKPFHDFTPKESHTESKVGQGWATKRAVKQTSTKFTAEQRDFLRQIFDQVHVCLAFAMMMTYHCCYMLKTTLCVCSGFGGGAQNQGKRGA